SQHAKPSQGQHKSLRGGIPMPTGLLIATGILDIAQFCPKANSDADTANVQIAANAFQFSPSGKAQDVQTTHVFGGAKLKGAKIDVLHNNAFTIRFQGIDAPELHFAALIQQKGPNKKKLENNGKEFRQASGESAAAALGAYLKAHM